MNQYFLYLLSLPLLLGTVVILRMLYTAAKVAKARWRPAVRGTAQPVVALLDKPFPCPTCASIQQVHVRRADFQSMPYVEHFLCHGCGTEFVGPNQEAMIVKRLEARRKLADIMAGRTVASKKRG